MPTAPRTADPALHLAFPTFRLVAATALVAVLTVAFGFSLASAAYQPRAGTLWRLLGNLPYVFPTPSQPSSRSPRLRSGWHSRVCQMPA